MVVAMFSRVVGILDQGERAASPRSTGGRRMRFALLLAVAVILVRDPTGKWVGDPLQPWFESLHNKAGLYCCSKADGQSLDDGE
jgi:hypothetical protein